MCSVCSVCLSVRNIYGVDNVTWTWFWHHLFVVPLTARLCTRLSSSVCRILFGFTPNAVDRSVVSNYSASDLLRNVHRLIKNPGIIFTSFICVVLPFREGWSAQRNISSSLQHQHAHKDNPHFLPANITSFMYIYLCIYIQYVMRISNEKYLPTNDALPPFSQWENMRIYAQSHRGASKTNNHRALNELIVNASASVASVLSKWWMCMEYRQCSCSCSINSSNRRTSTARPWIVSHASTASFH